MEIFKRNKVSSGNENISLNNKIYKTFTVMIIILSYPWNYWKIKVWFYLFIHFWENHGFILDSSRKGVFQNFFLIFENFLKAFNFFYSISIISDIFEKIVKQIFLKADGANIWIHVLLEICFFIYIIFFYFSFNMWI